MPRTGQLDPQVGRRIAQFATDLRAAKQLEQLEQGRDVTTFLGSARYADAFSGIAKAAGSRAALRTGGLEEVREALPRGAVGAPLDVGEKIALGPNDAAPVQLLTVHVAELLSGADRLVVGPGGVGVVAEYAWARALTDARQLDAPISWAGSKASALQRFARSADAYFSEVKRESAATKESVDWSGSSFGSAGRVPADKTAISPQAVAADSVAVLQHVGAQPPAVSFVVGHTARAQEAAQGLTALAEELGRHGVPLRLCGYSPGASELAEAATRHPQGHVDVVAQPGDRVPHDVERVEVRTPLALREAAVAHQRATVAVVDDWQSLSLVLSRVMEDVTNKTVGKAPIYVVDNEAGDAQKLFDDLYASMRELHGDDAQGFGRIRFLGPKMSADEAHEVAQYLAGIDLTAPVDRDEQVRVGRAIEHAAAGAGVKQLSAGSPTVHRLAEALVHRPDETLASWSALSAALSQHHVPKAEQLQVAAAVHQALRPQVGTAKGATQQHQLQNQLYQAMNRVLAEGAAAASSAAPAAPRGASRSAASTTVAAPSLDAARLLAVEPHAARQRLEEHLRAHAPKLAQVADFEARNAAHAELTAEVSALDACLSMGVKDPAVFGRVRQAFLGLATEAGEAFAPVARAPGDATAERLTAQAAAGPIAARHLTALFAALGRSVPTQQMRDEKLVRQAAARVAQFEQRPARPDAATDLELVSRAAEAAWRAQQVHRANLGEPTRVSVGEEGTRTPYAPYTSYRAQLASAEMVRVKGQRRVRGQAPVTDKQARDAAVELVAEELKKDLREL